MAERPIGVAPATGVSICDGDEGWAAAIGKNTATDERGGFPDLCIFCVAVFLLCSSFFCSIFGFFFLFNFLALFCLFSFFSLFSDLLPFPSFSSFFVFF